MKEEYLFWKLANFFIINHQYRLLQLSKEQNELWLEKKEHKETQLIRLLRYNLDWSNWMQRDMERTVMNGEMIRSQLTRGNIHVLNIYVTQFPPVDDYQFRLEKPVVHPASKKTYVKSVVIDHSGYNEQLHMIENMFGGTLHCDLPEEVEATEVNELKEETIASATNKMKEERALFRAGKPFFTYILMFIQIAVFLFLEIMGGSTNTANLIQYGAKFNPLILEGEWWRFITPIVLHIGLLHLATNTLALYFLGTALERIFGNARFLFIYFFAGVSGAVLSFIVNTNLSAGASGAIFGCLGALLYFGLIHPKLFFRTMGMNVLVILALNLAFGFTLPGVDNAGHIGGLIGGFIAAGVVHFPKSKKKFSQIAFLALAITLMSSLIQYGYAHPEDVLDEASVMLMAQTYFEKEEFEQAHDMLKDISPDQIQSAEYYFLLSFAEIRLEKFSEAKENLLKAIELNPNFHEAHYNLALVFLDQEQINEAKEHLEAAVELAPDKNEYVKLLNEVNNYLHQLQNLNRSN